jgi:hypothetical protein
MSKDTVREIDASIERDKKHIELDKALERLESNRDFKAVIIDGYLEKEAIRLVHLKSDPAMATPERQAAIVSQIDAIGGLLQYFRVISRNAAVAVKAIESAEAEREEILAEEQANG